jgi:hypothetical protein
MILGSIDCWGAMLQAGKSRVLVPMRLLNSIYPVLPAVIWPWGLLSLQQKRVPEDILGGKVRLERKVDKLTAICEPIT